MNAYQSILLAVDFSPLSERAATRALQVAKFYKAKLYVLHVVEEGMIYDTHTDMMLDDSASDFDFDNNQMFELAKQRMKELSDRMGFDDEVACEVVWGSASSTVINWAKEHEIELIVVGSYGQQGMERFLGSVSNSISQQASCDVLIVR